MPETLGAMSERLRAFQYDSVPNESPFGYSQSVREKIASGTGSFLPYYGNTVIFALDPLTRSWISDLSDSLHQALDPGLADRLPSSTAHVTLRDLFSSLNLKDVAEDVFLSDRQALEVAARIRGRGTVTMRATTVFNLTNTSISLGLIPDGDVEFETLLDARGAFDGINPPSAYTPHITLAYYRPDPPEPVDLNHLAGTLADLTRTVAGRTVTLPFEALHVAHFSDMATYWAVS